MTLWPPIDRRGHAIHLGAATVTAGKGIGSVVLGAAPIADPMGGGAGAV